MTTSDDHATERDLVHPVQDLEFEPTQILEFPTEVPEDGSEVGDSSDKSTSTINDAMQSLLRSRLLSVTLILGIFGVIRWIFGVFNPHSGESLAGVLLLSRSLFSFSVAALLASRLPLNDRKLRLLEYLYFGIETFAIVGSQYTVGNELIARNDIVHMVANDKNTIIRIIILMLMYGVLIPNRPKVTARVVLTMAFAPLLVLAVQLEQNTLSPSLKHLPIAELAVSNAIFVVLGACVSILAAYLLQNLHTDLHEARRLGQLGQYRLGAKLGEGGMGEVYMAEHNLLKRPCALKLIKASAESNPIVVARFEREVQAASALSHPNSIQIYDYGHAEDGTFYYVMEYLPGLSVAELVHQFGRLPPGRAVFIIEQVCQALQEAHHLGMVHRDLKPANVFVAILGGKCDVAKVLDFGLVKVTDAEGAPRLTTEFTVSGTPSFMSPEQAIGEREIDRRADIYSVGAILYFMVTGRPPFEKATPMELMIAQVSETVVPPSQLNSAVSQDLEAVILRCMAKVPAERYADTRALAAALAACDCASEWNQLCAEEWWLHQAESQVAEEGLLVGV